MIEPNSEAALEISRLKEIIRELREEAIFLSYLEAYGVDNWSGYDEAKIAFIEREEMISYE